MGAHGAQHNTYVNVLNIHERKLAASPAQVGALIDALASPRDRLSPRQVWPPMKLDRPLGVGAVGGHGPIRYVVEAYEPGRSVVFRFTGPKGFDGTHRFDVVNEGANAALRHTLAMKARGPALLSWPLLFRPLHDALLEDTLTNAERALGLEVHVMRWSPLVRLLRRMRKTA